MTPLSSPLEQIKAHYTVVVVGSGYGGAIAASRLARAGQSVCLLERGKEYVAGDFPQTQVAAALELQSDLPTGRVGSRLALFDLRVNEEMNVVLGCGLGGTSLINASVALRADARVFDDARWPEPFRNDVGGVLEASYGHVQAMLKPVAYPESAPPLAKYAGLQRSAHALGAQCTRPPITVCFANGVNHVGVAQRACDLCGDCICGCNHGAKSSLNMNYLPDARNHGAEIYTQAAVKCVERREGRWIVHYQAIGTGREAFDAPLQFLSADVVILAAGTLGTTEILLRSRAAGLALSARLGERFTGNGDVIGFGYNNDRPMNGVGFGNHDGRGVAPVGPCISGVVDLRNTASLDDGMVIEEGALPGALGRLLAPALSASDALDDRDPKESLARKAAKAWRAFVSWIRGPYHGAVHHTQTYLVMAHDDSGGTMSLSDDRLRITWPRVGEQPVFRRIDQVLTKATRANGGEYVPNPLWSDLLAHRAVTVHPLGGAVMAERAEEGAVNHKGQLFCGECGTEVYEGLYVCDGAVVPRSLGVNPLLTISAIAERCAALIARDRGWRIDYTLPSAPKSDSGEKIGISFTETMTGYVMPSGGGDDSPFRFTVTIVSDDLEQLVSDKAHRARISGTVEAPLLDPSPLMVTDGEFGLLVEDAEEVGMRRMTYRMPLTTESGRRFLFEGFKRVHDDRGFDLWSDTTTLFCTVREGDTHGRVVATGVLKIEAEAFLRQLTTIKAINARSAREELAAIARFGRFFAGTLFDTYGGLFARNAVFDADAPPRRKRALRVPAPQTFPVRTADDLELRLLRYHGGDKGPVMVTHGLGVSSAIFTVDTIETNLLEFLVANGYDVWLLDFRASIELPASSQQFTADEIALHDYPAAVVKVREVTGAASIQVVAHCFGSTTFIMAMLAGLDGVRAAVCSQVAAHIKAPLASEVKAGLHLPSILDALGIESLTAYVDNHADWRQKLFDQALKFAPVQEGERCTSATCHRISFMYGPLYCHGQLNTATHETLHELFGIANMTAFEHLARMVRREQVVRADGADLYLPHAKRLAIPMLFIHGAENRCFLPESTEITLKWLSDTNGPDLYNRKVIPGYGHIDCIFGKHAARDVYGHILDHLQKN